MSECAVPPAPIVGNESQEPASTAVFVAGFWRRLLAGVIDLCCLAPALLFFGWLAIKVSGTQLFMASEFRIESVLELFFEGGNLVFSMIIIGIMIILLYGFLFTVTTGATPGKRLIRMRVINVYGDPPQWWRVVVRCLAFLVSSLMLGLGLLWIGFDREKRGLHDWVSGTYVIRNKTTEGT